MNKNDIISKKHELNSLLAFSAYYLFNLLAKLLIIKSKTELRFRFSFTVLLILKLFFSVRMLD